MLNAISGGGKYKEPVLIKLKEVYPNGQKFTLAEAKTLVSGLCISFIWDFLQSGDIKKAETYL